MNSDHELVSQQDLLTVIEDFVSKSQGLSLVQDADGNITVAQKNDSKKLRFRRFELADVLVRKDGDGREFVQVNLASGKKILLTDQLVGFKPMPIGDLDVTKLPKVVTTMDLLSVFEAIEDAISSTMPQKEEAEALKRVFQSILQGGEDVGFDLSLERSWLRRLPSIITKSSV